jgi:hypothetical protein
MKILQLGEIADPSQVRIALHIKINYGSKVV